MRLEDTPGFFDGRELMIGDGAYGKVLTLNKEWSDDLIWVFEREHIQTLVLHRLPKWDPSQPLARPTFRRTNLDFLAKVPQLRSLTVLDRSVPDISGVHHLPELRYLYMGDYSGKPIDFSCFPLLEECYIEFTKNRRSVALCTKLKSLSLQHYAYKDVTVLTPLSELTELWFSQGGLGDISAIGAFPDLKLLTLALLRNLRDISPLSTLKKVEELDLEGSKNFANLDAVSEMRALRTLNMSHCGNIDALKPLERCENLEVLRFGGDTTILDGDMTILLRMPKLRLALFGNRKHYNMKREDIPAFPESMKP